jgi:hypothetical protein
MADIIRTICLMILYDMLYPALFIFVFHISLNEITKACSHVNIHMYTPDNNFFIEVKS